MARSLILVELRMYVQDLISPLVMAAAANNVEMAKELIRWGAEPRENCWVSITYKTW